MAGWTSSTWMRGVRGALNPKPYPTLAHPSAHCHRLARHRARKQQPVASLPPLPAVGCVSRDDLPACSSREAGGMPCVCARAAAMLQSCASPSGLNSDMAHVLGCAQSGRCSVCSGGNGGRMDRINVRCLSCLSCYAHFECAVRSVAPWVCRECVAESSERSGFTAAMQARPRPALLLWASCCGCLLASEGLWWRPGRVKSVPLRGSDASSAFPVPQICALNRERLYAGR